MKKMILAAILAGSFLVSLPVRAVDADKGDHHKPKKAKTTDKANHGKTTKGADDLPDGV
jgi:hypothetical protein